MNSEQMKQLGIKEVFLPIDRFHNYEVSNYGNVRNKLTGTILKPMLRNDYHRIVLYNENNGRVHQNIHRLVLNAFENNPENKPYIDHIDNDPSNNCLFNLRYVTNQQNQFNRSINSKNNTSGVKGICFNKRQNKWQAHIGINGKKLHIGLFDNIEDAKIARVNKAKELFGQYINQCEL